MSFGNFVKNVNYLLEISETYLNPMLAIQVLILVFIDFKFFNLDRKKHVNFFNSNGKDLYIFQLV